MFNDVHRACASIDRFQSKSKANVVLFRSESGVAVLLIYCDRLSETFASGGLGVSFPGGVGEDEGAAPAIRSVECCAPRQAHHHRRRTDTGIPSSIIQAWRRCFLYS